MRRPARHQLHLSVPDGLNEHTARLVLGFANALAAKLFRAQEKYRYTDGWLTQNWEAECRQQLMDHLQKGDPLDVAAYCAFIWHRHWSTTGALQPQPADAGMREALKACRPEIERQRDRGNSDEEVAPYEALLTQIDAALAEQEKK